MEEPDVPKALADRVVMRLGIDLSTISYFIGSERILVTARPGMAMWREHLYSFILRNSSSAIDLFKLPINQTLQIGVGVEL
jgi:KUP system potassium uptake protein